MNVVWSPLAAQRAMEAVDYIAQDRPRTAEIWLEKLLECVSRLEQFEQHGRPVPEIGIPAYREILHAPYRIIYRVDDARVVSLTLRHVRRDWDPTDINQA